MLEIAWKATVASILAREVVNQDSIRDALDAACDEAVTEQVLGQYSLHKLEGDSVDAEGVGALRAELGSMLRSAMVFVVRDRKPGGEQLQGQGSGGGA